MGDKASLCHWCGQFTELRDGFGDACCDRDNCLNNRIHDRDCDCPNCEFQPFEVEGSTVHVHLTE